jgi:hypothetical protein
MYDPNTTHGYADQKAFWEIPISDLPALTGAEEPTRVAKPGEFRRFAHLVYQVNSSPISGNVTVDLSSLETINSDGFDTLSTQLDHISGQLDELCDCLSGSLSGQSLSSLETINSDGFDTLSTQLDHISGQLDQLCDCLSGSGSSSSSGTTALLAGFTSGAHLDAFARLRVSNPRTLFDSKQLHDKLPTFWDEVSGGSATSVHVSADAMTEMTVTASSADFVIRQTKVRFNYQPGKSQLIILTAAQMAQQTGVTKRIGAFADDGTGNNLTPKNGIFLQSDGTNISWNIAKNGVVTESVNRASWNIDPMNGTGPTGYNLDFDKTLIYFIDYSWLGSGSVRAGFVVDECIHYAHVFKHANVTFSAYMSTPNLPLRYDIQSDGTGAGTLDHICSTIISEGGQEATGITRSASRGDVEFQTQNDTDIYPLVSIRLKEGYEDISITPINISAILTSNADYRWLVVVHPDIAGTDAASWTPVLNSAVEYDISRDNTNKITGGEVIATGYVDKGQKAQIESSVDDPLFKLGSLIDGTKQELILAVQPVVGANETFYGAITWRELE